MLVNYDDFAPAIEFRPVGFSRRGQGEDLSFPQQPGRSLKAERSD